jgi:hypothetical protein
MVEQMKLNLNELISDEIIEIICINCYDMWISSLTNIFDMIDDKINKKLTFEEQKEIFLTLLEKLLDKGKIELLPNKYEMVYEPSKGYYTWNIPHKKMIEHIRNAIPTMNNIYDGEMTHFWYSDDCPRILWI